MSRINAALVRRAMLEDLAASGIEKPSHVKKLAVEPLTPEECEEITDIRVPGYVIPYFDERGRVLSVARRVKFLTPPPNNPNQKYWQKADTIPRAYLCPLLQTGWPRAIRDNSVPLYITEGEKKAACACLHGLACVGLGGVWSFKSKKAGLTLLKELERFAWRGRVVHIVFDSDIVEKPEVMRAMQSLASVLRTKGVADIRSIYLASDGEKVGLDDFIVERGVDALSECASEQSDALLESLSEFNTRYAVIQAHAGKIFSTEKRSFIGQQPFVKVAEAHRIVPVVDDLGKPRRARVAEEWLAWPNRREFADLVFEPGQPTVTERNEYNFWSGYPYSPKRGSVKPFLDLVDQVFSRSPDEARRWFLQWAAYPLAHPGTKLASAVIVWGDQGTGKTFLGKIVKSLYGEYGRLLEQLSLDTSFNEWMINAQFVLADEVVFHGDRRESNALKNIITRDTVSVNQKYQPTYTVRDYANYYFTSNHADAIHMERGDRRFLVVEAGPKQPRRFYSSIDRWLAQPDSYRAVMDYLCHRVDLSSFDPLGEPPLTEQKEDMIHETMSGLDQVIEEAVRSPDDFLQIAGNPIPRDLFTADEILALLPSEFRGTSRNAVGRALRRAGCPKRGASVKTPGGASAFRRLYALRNLDRWRSAGPAEVSRHYAQALSILDDGKVVSLDKARRRKFAGTGRT